MNQKRAKQLEENGWQPLPNDPGLFVRKPEIIAQDPIDWTTVPEKLAHLRKTDDRAAPRDGSTGR
jgi:hypothetical protein